jgi:hypothetical protein
MSLRQHDKDVFLSAFGMRPFDSQVIKEFLRSFPVFNPTGTGDPRYLLLAYFARVVSYCANFGFYLPPSHTLSSGDMLGRWFQDLPHGVQSLAQNSFSGFLAQAFQAKQTGLMSHASIRDILLTQDDCGYTMYYAMHILAQHPLLMSYPGQDVEPTQSADMTVGTYLQRWNHYVHVQLLHGIFISDRYFLLQLVAGMSPRVRDTIGRLLASDAVEKVSNINNKLPNSFAPDQLHIKLVELARYAGHPELVSKTPRDLIRPTREIREISAFGQMMAQVSTPGASDAGYPARRCFFCGKADCTLTTCKAASAAKDDSFTRKNLARYFGIRAMDLVSGEDPDSSPLNVGDDVVTEDLLGLHQPPADDSPSATPDFR